MFTGLVSDVGKLERFSKKGASARVVIRSGFNADDPLTLGESIAVNGVCLTVDSFSGTTFEADLSAETLARSTLGALKVGGSLNLERSMKLGGRMGGHVVLGHVDAVGTLVSAELVGGSQRTEFSVGRELAPYLAHKGSVAVDGVSLTINDVRDHAERVDFDVMLVPHTLGRTTLATITPHSQVNVEIDVLARYVERQISLANGGTSPVAKDEAALLEKLRSGGYI